MTESLQALVERRCDTQGWTLERLASEARFEGKIRLSTSGLRKLLRGQVREARGPTIAALAVALGVKPGKVRASLRVQCAVER